MPQAKKQEVAEKQNTNMATTMADMEGDAMDSSGFEEAESDSYAIPFMTIIQALSPQVDKQKAEFVKGIEAGHVFNSATFEFGESITVIPCHFRRQFIEWQPDRGGLVDIHNTVDGQRLLATATRGDSGGDILPNGNSLVDTREHFVLVVHDDGTTERAVVNMSSTQMKKSKRWMTLMQNIKFPTKNDATQMYTPPMYSHLYKLGSAYESNDKGSWYGWAIEKVGGIENPAHYAEAKAFRDSIVSGAVEVKHEGDEKSSEKVVGSNDDFDDDASF